MAKPRTVFECSECRQTAPRWAGRCATCGGWGTLVERAGAAGPPLTTSVVPLRLGGPAETPDPRILTGLEGLDRVLGGGLVPGSVILVAGEPGIGKSTLLLHLLGALADQGRSCVLASGEESRAQVAARARRLGLGEAPIEFLPGRETRSVVEAILGLRPDVVAVDSIQTIRDPEVTHVPGGVAQVRAATDALVGAAKDSGTCVVLTGHVTKDGDLAGPRALEHAVDVVLAFDGDARSGLRVLASGKNRFGSEGETTWFEMGPAGLVAIDPAALLVSGHGLPGAAIALPQRGRRALAVEVQALVGAPEGSGRRQATGLDLRRFQLVAAVLDRAVGLGIGRAEVFGAASGGIRVDDPACDLAVAAALASAATGISAPEQAAFVGEVALTGQIRPVAGMPQRLAAARAAGCRTVFAPAGADARTGVRTVPVQHLAQALTWCAGISAGGPRSLPA